MPRSCAAAVATAAATSARPPAPPARRLRKLTAPKVSPVVLAITYIGWLTSLSVVALVPIDVYIALAHQNQGPLATLWSISYWCGEGERRRQTGPC